MHRGYTCASLILTHPVVLPSLVCLSTEDGGVEETQILEIRKKPFFPRSLYLFSLVCVEGVFLPLLPSSFLLSWFLYFSCHRHMVYQLGFNVFLISCHRKRK